MSRANAIVVGIVLTLAGAVLASTLRGSDGAGPRRAATAPKASVGDDATMLGARVDRLSAPGHSALYPRAVTGPDGTVTAIWERYDGRSLVVQSSSRRPGGSWTRPLDVSHQAVDAGRAEVVVGGDGVVTAVWTAPGLTVARRRPGTGGWSSPEQIATIGPASSFAVAATDSGRVTIAWSDASAVEGSVHAATVVAGSGLWRRSTVKALGPSEATGTLVAVASGRDRVTVGWLLQRYGLCDRLEAATATGSSGRWTVQDVMSATRTEEACPSVLLASDRGGRQIAAWQEGGFRVAMGQNTGWEPATVVAPASGDLVSLAGVAVGADGAGDLLVEKDLLVEVASRTPAGTWSGLVPLSSGPEATAADNLRLAPQLAVARSGSAIVVWMAQDRSRRPVIRIATRYGSAGAWSTPIGVPSPRGVHDVRVSLGADGRTATVVWQTAAMPRFGGLVDAADGTIETLTVHMPSPPVVADPAPGVTVTDVSLPGSEAVAPLVVAGADGLETALWGAWDGQQTVLHAATRGRDGRWSDPVIVSEPGQDATGARLVASPDGSVTAVWLGSRLLAARRPAGSARWSSPVALAPFRYTIAPAVAVTASGRVTVLWIADGEVRARALAAYASSWSAVEPVARLHRGVTVDEVDALVAGRDRVTALWGERRGATCLGILAATRGTGWTVTTAWRAPPAYPGCPLPLRAVVGPPAGASAIAFAPGGALVAARETDRGVELASRPRGGRWSPFRAVAPPDGLAAGTDARSPRVAVAPNGTVVVAWVAAGDGGLPVLRAVTRAAGSVAWSPVVGVPVGEAVVSLAVAAASDARHAILVWVNGPRGSGSGSVVVRSLVLRLP